MKHSIKPIISLNLLGWFFCYLTPFIGIFTILLHQQQVMTVPVYSKSHQRALLLTFWFSNLICEKWYLSVVFICISYYKWYLAYFLMGKSHMVRVIYIFNCLFITSSFFYGGWWSFLHFCLLEFLYIYIVDSNPITKLTNPSVNFFVF